MKDFDFYGRKLDFPKPDDYDQRVEKVKAIIGDQPDADFLADMLGILR